MAFYPYITLGTVALGTFKFKTPAKSWQVVPLKPATFRFTLMGAADVTYGPGDYKEWQGLIEGTLSPGTGYGTLQNLRDLLAVKGPVTFHDHYDWTYTVHILGPFPEKSIHPNWTDASNKIYIQVRIVKA